MKRAGRQEKHVDSQYEVDSLTAASHIERKMLGSISELEVEDAKEEDDEDDDELDRDEGE